MSDARERGVARAGGEGCAQARVALGAFVLGALDPAERSDVERHVAGCTACRDELAALAALPGLLARLHPSDVAALTPPVPRGGDGSSEDGLRSLLARAARQRRRVRARMVLLAAAAAAVVAAAGGAVGWAAARYEPARPTLTATDRTTGVRAELGLADRPWGTAVTLRLSDVPAGERCRLVAVGRGGQREVAGSWAAVYAPRGLAVEGATALPRAELAAFDVLTSDGRRLVSIPVPGSPAASST